MESNLIMRKWCAAYFESTPKFTTKQEKPLQQCSQLNVLIPASLKQSCVCAAAVVVVFFSRVNKFHVVSTCCGFIWCHAQTFSVLRYNSVRMLVVWLFFVCVCSYWPFFRSISMWRATVFDYVRKWRAYSASSSSSGVRDCRGGTQ